MTVTRRRELSPAGQLDRYLRVIAAGAHGGHLLEIRYAIRGGDMARVFVPPRRLDRAARVIRSLAPRTDVYCGVVLRTRRAGGRDAVTRSHLAWVEIDAVNALERLARFPRTPSMIVSSGTPGHAHAYFALRTAVAPAEVEQANRTLARHLGGDPASVDASRILRPAGTLSHKHQPPAPVELLHVDPAVRYELAELLDGLEPAPPRAPAGRAGAHRTARTELDELLLAIPAATYVRLLAGREPNRAGKVHCPFHNPDDTPSLQLYEDGTWCCFAPHGTEGRIGGSIYDFAARLWNVDTKGPAFIQLRARLADTVGAHAASKVKPSFQA
jgi:hypothetical protein